ncbi:MAG TPA: DUF302 domain-containing protein [Candidatus Cybelea sp.]|nr:DUF302 domain-containing protein [Candidatus Cybelea sp.]
MPNRIPSYFLRTMTATVTTKISAHSYPKTLERLSAAIRSAGNTIFATIDQSAAAESVGMALRPTTLIVFGNPKGGTPLMDAYPLVALDLPLKILVWEVPEGVKIGYVPMSSIAARYGVEGMAARIAAMDATLVTLTESAAGAH